MSTQYNGNAALVVPSTSVNIASSTNTNPIVITTSAPHGLTSKDVVDVKDHQTNTAANGVNAATVLSPTTFSIPVAGVGVGGATGTVQSLALGETFAIPSDGDNENGASVDVSLETLADRTAFLAAATGKYKLVGLFRTPLSDDSMTVAEWPITTSAPATYTAPSSGGSIVTVTGLLTTDLVEVAFSCTASGGIQFGLALGKSSYAPGAAPPAPTRIAGSGQRWSAGTSTFSGFNLHAVVAPSVNGNLDFWVMAQTLGGTGTVNVYEESFGIVKVWRPTGQPQ